MRARVAVKVNQMYEWWPRRYKKTTVVLSSRVMLRLFSNRSGWLRRSLRLDRLQERKWKRRGERLARKIGLGTL